ncbi:hypothetical protein BDV93DRAFT_549617 [Ceratobasidium sp. AG-I]|nr:hypothetical protein BDV93DRAFT_549617 [Ceratobasidium sp. AG-I]
MLDLVMNSYTRRVLEVSELVSLICGYIRLPDLVNLMTMSHHFFYCAAPLVWKDVSGIKGLVNLLPGESGNLQLRFEPCEQAQLARFNTYAPLIQKFQLNIDVDADLPNWAMLLANVPARPLLPNLRVLIVGAQGSREDGSRVEKCVNALLCPTLSDIRTMWGCDRFMDPIQAAGLLLGMARICPNLSKLRLLARHSEYPSDLDSLGTYFKTALLISISRFQNLRILSTSSVVLDPDILQLLGNLPHLEALTAASPPTSGMSDDQLSISNYALPIHSFPALRHLKIYFIPSTVVSKLWQTAPLVQNLVSVAVIFMHDSIESISNLICDICRGSPLTVDLDLDLVEVGNVELSNNVVYHLEQLPLQRVRISNWETKYQSVAPAFRNVEYLISKTPPRQLTLN